MAKITKVSEETKKLFEDKRLSREDVIANLKQDYTQKAIDECVGSLSFEWISKDPLDEPFDGSGSEDR